MDKAKLKVDYEINKFFDENPDSIFIEDKNKILDWVYIQGYDELDDEDEYYYEYYDYDRDILKTCYDNVIYTNNEYEDSYFQVNTDKFDEYEEYHEGSPSFYYPENREYSLRSISDSHDRKNHHCNPDWLGNLLDHTYTRIPLIKSSKNIRNDSKVRDDIEKFGDFMKKLMIKVYLFSCGDNVKWNRGSATLYSDDLYFVGNNMILLCNLRRGYNSLLQESEQMYYFSYD